MLSHGLLALLCALAFTVAAAAAQSPQQPIPRPNALLYVAGISFDTLWTTVIDVENNSVHTNDKQKLGEEMGYTQIHIDNKRSRFFLSYHIGWQQNFVGYDLASSKPIGGFPLDYGVNKLVSVFNQESDMHGSQLIVYGNAFGPKTNEPTTISGLTFLNDKVMLRTIKVFNSSSMTSYGDNEWIISYPEIDRIILKTSFGNDPNNFKVFDFSGNLIAETSSSQLQPYLRLYQDPTVKGFVATYQNETGGIKTCFARFDLQTLQIIQNTKDGRCYDRVATDWLVYSPQNNGFFVLQRRYEWEAISLFFYSLDQLPPPRIVNPIMKNVPIDWMDWAVKSGRLAVLRG